MKPPLVRAGLISLSLGALGCGDPREAAPLKPSELFRGGRSPLDSRREAGWTNFLDPQELHRAWAPPAASPWRPYYKPTLIAAMAAVREAAGPVHGPEGERAAQAAHAFSSRLILEPDTAVIVDLEHEAAVIWALAFARLGFQPVLTVNNWPHQAGAVRLERTLGALLYHAGELAALKLPAAAPPVFFLDRARLSPKGGALTPSVFDNRYFHTVSDLPPAALLKQHGVKRLFYVNPKGVAGGAEEDDLVELFAAYAKDGLRFDYVQPAADGSCAHGQPVPVTRTTMFSAPVVAAYASTPATTRYHSSYLPFHVWHGVHSRPSWSTGTWGSHGGGTRSFSSG